MQLKQSVILVTLLLPGSIQATSTAIATFAGGCFWCMEKPFDDLDGVVSTQSGYTGGDTKNPDYEDVLSGETGHFEAIQIIYYPEKISYQKLLDVFWKNIDPTNSYGQFCDNGDQYRSSIFYHNAEQKKLAYGSLIKLKRTKPFKEEIVTEITAARKFYPAENYHQDYYLKNPLLYKLFRYTCGRDSRLKELWGNKFN